MRTHEYEKLLELERQVRELVREDKEAFGYDSSIAFTVMEIGKLSDILEELDEIRAKVER